MRSSSNTFASPHLAAALAAAALAGCLGNDIPGRVGDAVDPRDGAATADGLGNASEAIATDDATTAPERPELACTDPAASYDELWWSGDDGLYRAPVRGGAPARVDAWATGEVAASAVVAPSATASDVEVLVAVRSADGGCELRGYDRTGASPWRASGRGGGACQRPATATGPDGARTALWPEASDLVVVSLATGSESARAALTAAATTPLVPVDLPDGELDGGGSHWLVGVGGRVSLVDAGDAPLVAASLDVPDGVVTALVPLGPALVALVARAGPERGYGSTIRLVTIDRDGQVPRVAFVGEPMTAPGSILAHPVALHCDALAGGGSHWWCPSALLAAAGDGWLRAWRMPDGVVAYDADVADFAWTGLAFGGDGRIAGGGSHWLPGEERWRLDLIGPDGSTFILGGEGLACLPSPLVGSDGLVTTPVLTRASVAVEAVASDLTAATDGWPRPGGEGANASRSATPTCVDGGVRARRVGVTDRSMSGVVAAGDAVLLTGQLATLPPRVRIAWMDRDGGIRDELAVSDDPPINGLSATAAYGDTPLLAWTHDEGPSRVIHVASAVRGAPLAPLGTYAVELTGAVADLVVRLDDAIVGYVGAGYDTLVRFPLDGSGPVAGPTFSAAPLGMTRLAVSPGGGVAIAGRVYGDVDGDTLFVRVLNAGLDERWVRTVKDGTKLRPTDVGVAADGSVAVSVDSPSDGASGPVTNRSIYRWDTDGNALPTIALGADVLTTVAAPDGSYLVLTQAGGGAYGVRRIGPLGTRGALVPLTVPPGLSIIAGAADEAGGFVTLWTTLGTPSSVAVVSLDGRGFGSCSDAGLCVWSADDACDGGDACTARGCDPATGACVTSPSGAPGCP